MSDDMIDQLYHAAARGWLLVLLNRTVVDNERFWRELPTASAQHRVMFIIPSGIISSIVARTIPQESLVVQTRSLEGALEEAARRMLTGGPDGETA
jgi:hypothetical protein